MDEKQSATIHCRPHGRPSCGECAIPHSAVRSDPVRQCCREDFTHMLIRQDVVEPLRLHSTPPHPPAPSASQDPGDYIREGGCALGRLLCWFGFHDPVKARILFGADDRSVGYRDPEGPRISGACRRCGE